MNRSTFIAYIAILIVFSGCKNSNKENQNVPINYTSILNTRIFAEKSLNKNLESIEFSGKYTVIDFWATWCAPCIKGFKHYNELASNKALNEKINFFIISDEPEDKIVKRLKNREIKAYNLIDAKDSIPNDCGFKGKTFKEFDVCAIPYGVILSPDGEVVWKGDTSDLTITNLTELVSTNGNKLTPKVENDLSFNSKVPDTIGDSKTYKIITKQNVPMSINGMTNHSLKNRYSMEGASLRKIVQDLAEIKNYQIKSESIDIDSVFYEVRYLSYPEKIKEDPYQFLLNKLLNHYSYKATKNVEEILVTELFIEDSSKLANHTALKSKTEDYGGSDVDENQVVIINRNLEECIYELNEIFDFPIQLQANVDLSKRYDIEISVSNKEDILHVLKQDYGVSNRKVLKPVELITIAEK